MSDLPLHLQPYADAIGFIILAIFVAVFATGADIFFYLRDEYRHAMGRQRRQQKNPQGEHRDETTPVDARREQRTTAGRERQDGDHGSERRDQEELPEDTP